MVKKQRTGKKKPTSGVRAYVIKWRLEPEDFLMSTGRAPRNQQEFYTWWGLIDQGLGSGHVDLSVFDECATEAPNESYSISDINDLIIKWRVPVKAFAHILGRAPRDQEELDTFGKQVQEQLGERYWKLIGGPDFV